MRLFQSCWFAALALIACGPQDTLWDTHSVVNGPLTSELVTVTGAQPGAAEYDSALHVPVCTTVSNLCDSMALVEGRGPMGPELHAPNTLDGCADGTHNEPYHHPEQIHWLRVSRTDGRPFVAGRRVRVDVAVELPRFTAENVLSIDLYSASDATAPVWTYQKSIPLHPNFNPEHRGFYVGSAEYVLPTGSMQALRARFGAGSTFLTPCGTGATEDRDDLAFAVGQEVDQTPPTVAITAPANDAPVNSGFTLKAEAGDDFNVTHVAFYVGETLIGTDTSAPFSVEWYNGNLSEGPYTLTAKAYDAAGHVSTSAPIPVTLDHTNPYVMGVSPASETFVGGTTQLSASASDANGIRAVAFYDGPVQYGSLIGYATAPPYAVNWNTLGLGNGRRSLYTGATDRAGNLSELAVTTVTVDNAPPTVAITSPGSGGKVLLSTTIQATASDNNAVTQVEFYDGGKLIGTDTTAPYSVSWSTLLVPKGQHTLTARATDVAGNVTSSAGILVTVQ